MKLTLVFFMALGTLGTLATLRTEEKPLRVVENLDLKRYAGKWYEIARLPNRFQERCSDSVTATYTLKDDGTISVLNQCRTAEGEGIEAKGVARKAKKDGKPSILKVRFAPGILSFLPQVWGDYQVLELAGDYGHALVGSPDRKYLWILSRKPVMDEDVYRQLVSAAQGQGFEATKLVRTIQK